MVFMRGERVFTILCESDWYVTYLLYFYESSRYNRTLYVAISTGIADIREGALWMSGVLPLLIPQCFEGQYHTFDYYYKGL
jgi:hypothetical protein